jgi:MFS family permease
VLFGTLFVVPYYLVAKHVGFGLVGLQLSVLPVAIGIAAPIAGRLLNRVGDRPLTGGGMILAGAGLLEIALWHSTTGLLTGLALTGLGLGAFTPANNATIMAASPPGHTGVVSGVLNMTRGMGTAVGVALASAIYIAAAGANGTQASRDAAAHGFNAALALLDSVALTCGVLLLLHRSNANADASSRRQDRPRRVRYPAGLDEPDPAPATSTSRPGQ